MPMLRKCELNWLFIRTTERYVSIVNIELESLKVSNFLLLLETLYKNLAAGEDAPPGVLGARRVSFCP